MNKINIPKTHFPLIENIKDVIPFIENKPEIRVQDSGLDTVSVIYKMFDNNTFDKDIVRESRGMTFDKHTGKIIGRPLHKFFNMGERIDTEKENVDFKNLIAVWDKIDGSMISAHRVKGDIRFKTQKNFLTKESMDANKFAHANQNIINFCNELVDDFTPVFEFKDPAHVIVVPYDKKELVFLHLRHIKTGAYIDYKDPGLNDLLKKYDIPYLIPKAFPEKNGLIDINFVLNHLKETQGIEGYVFQFKGGEMIKAKSDWYNAQHRAEAGLRVRDVAYMYLDGTLDDIKGNLKTEGYNINPILDIESQILKDLNKIEKTVKRIVELNKGLSIKNFAKKVNEDSLLNRIAGPLIAEFRNIDFDYNYYYKKNIVDSGEKYGLEYIHFENKKENKSSFIRKI